MLENAGHGPSYLVVNRAGPSRRIAYRHVPAASDKPTIVWLGGYRSDMLGTKAEHLSAVAAREGLGFCRLDYSGHGESEGRFEDGTISSWLEDAAAVIESTVRGPSILVGSSMGAWIALRLVAMARGGRALPPLVGLLLIAPAPDFTEKLLLPKLSSDQREALADNGVLRVPSPYGPEPDVYTSALIEDGRSNLVMGALIETGCPVTILQGMADEDVPYLHALELVNLLPAEGVSLTLVRDGDHRLSRPEDLALIERSLLALVEEAKQRD